MVEGMKEPRKTKQEAVPTEPPSYHKDSIRVHCEHCKDELIVVYPFYNKSLTGCASVALNAKCKKCGKYTFTYIGGKK